MFEPKIDINKLNPIDPKITNTSNGVSKVQKKGCIADAITSSVKSIKSENIPPPPKKEKVDAITNGVKDIKSDNMPPPKKDVLKQPTCRFSLPIFNNCYKDYYSGSKIAEYLPDEDQNSDTSNWKSSWDYNSDQISVSSRSSKSSKSSYSSKNDSMNDMFFNDYLHQKETLDLNSKVQFPPL